MKTVLIAISLLIGSEASIAGVANKDLEEIRELTKTGQFQQALDKHLWFHEESKSSPSMGGVRLSYAITAWLELAAKYPPALEALVELREKNKEILLSGDGDFNNFHDLAAINQALGESEVTLELFLTLDQSYPKQSSSYYIVAEELLIEHKRYDICAKYMGDPVVKYENVRHQRELGLSFARTNSSMNTPSFLEYTDQSFIDGVLKLIEVLIAINKPENAHEIQQRALSYFPTESIKYAIQ